MQNGFQQDSWELPERIPGHVAQSCFQQAEVFQTFLELVPGTWLKLFSSNPPTRDGGCERVRRKVVVVKGEDDGAGKWW